MSRVVSKSRLAIAEEAAEWFLDLREAHPSLAAKSRFVDWICESPVHVEEYLAVAKLYGALSHVEASSIADAESLVDDTIVALHGEAPSYPPLAPSLSPRQRRARCLGFAASVLAAAFAFALMQSSQIYVGEWTVGNGGSPTIPFETGFSTSLRT